MNKTYATDPRNQARESDLQTWLLAGLCLLGLAVLILGGVA